MIRFKQALPARIPVRLRSAATGAPLAGVLFGAVTASVEKANGVEAIFTVTAPDWVALVTGAAAGSGNYTLILPDSLTDVVGRLRIVVNASGALEQETVLVEIVSYTEAELKTLLDALSAQNADTQSALGDIRQVLFGSRRVIAEGEDAFREVSYEDDDSTALAKWELKDENGEPTIGPNILEKVAVSLGGGD